MIARFTAPALLLMVALLAFGPLPAGAQGSGDGPAYSEASAERFDEVRETGHLCMDGLGLRLLSTERRPDPESCSANYAACEGDDCLFVIHGALRRIGKQRLLDHGVFVASQLRRLDEEGRTAAYFPPFPTWTPPGFVDPVCGFYHQLGFDCPDAPGLPGGGASPPPGTGTPGTPGPDDNCWLCTTEHGLCFVQAKKGLIAHAACISRFQQCTARRCG